MQLYKSQVNAHSEQLNSWVQNTAASWLAKGKAVGLLGGDHSCPFGLIKALSEVHDDFGILHIDAHFDLRKAYEGFRWSHASIMRNVLEHSDSVTSIAHVGIRDFCESEWLFARKDPRCSIFSDADIMNHKMTGQMFSQLVGQILDSLPQKIYISFDIDGLEPSLCPNTGTPVPGGLNAHEVNFLLEEIDRRNKQVIGFDLSEVASMKGSDWDYNVGSRMLYKLCGILINSAQRTHNDHKG